ncbi:endogenous retrovirus group S71 member 1 Env polyprotein-like [Glossophaga mutica]
MASPAGSRQALKAYLFTCLGLLILGGAPGQGLEQREWVIIRTLDGTVIATNYTWETSSPITLRVDFSHLWGEKLCDDGRLHSINPHKPQSLQGVSEGYGNICENSGEENLNRDLWYTPFYGCPEPPSGKRRTCGSSADFYCKAWGCETLTNGGWNPGGGKDKHITLQRDKRHKPSPKWNDNCAKGNCNPTIVTVLNPGDPEWVKGRTWGIRLYVTGRDPGTLLTIRKLPTKGGPLLRGASGRLPPRPPKPTLRPVSSEPEGTTGTPGPVSASPGPTGTSEPLQFEEENNPRPPLRDPEPLIGKPHHQGESALSLLEQVFPYFNSTQPDITESCWLCLSPRPPFYVGLGVDTTQGREGAPVTGPLPTEQDQMKDLQQCTFESTITLAEFHGQGTCYLLAIYTLANSNYSDYCLNQEHLPGAPGNLTITKAPDGLWFICTQGIFKCLVPITPELCVSAYIIPQVYLYGGDPDFLLQPPARVKRVPLLIPIVATIGVVGSAAVGAGALIHGENSLRQLSQTFSKDISLLQEQVVYLEHQVDSLAEVELQNRRGLDLVFLQQGGLCAALGEECCFYANHSGVIRENIKMFTRPLKEREQESESSSWYASLYETSPWLTTLISALASPLVLLLLTLTIGPIILNKLLAFIRERIEVVKLMVLSQPYTRLAANDSESRV